MNIQNRMDSSLMMDRAVRKERQKLRSHTKSYRVSGQGADNSKLYDKLISKNQDADKTGADIIQSERFPKKCLKKQKSF